MKVKEALKDAFDADLTAKELEEYLIWVDKLEAGYQQQRIDECNDKASLCNDLKELI